MALPLPAPGSPELTELLGSKLHQSIYEVLYLRRDDPPTIEEIQDFVRDQLGPGKADQIHFNKRVRELRDHFIIPSPQSNSGRYELVGRKEVSKADENIPRRLAAEVLKHQRCAMCGKTPLDDGVRLHIDHKIPREWGGSSDLENLQPLCSDCNEGKKSYFSSFDENADHIAAAISYDEPHKRIGELLKAFEPDEVRSDLIDIVASTKQFQEDWQKRARELRVLGWDYDVRKEKDENGRVRSYYRLTKSEPWPDGSVRAEISRREKARKK